MKKIRIILFFIGIVMIACGIGLVFVNFTNSSISDSNKQYTVDDAIKVLKDTLGYTDEDVEFISQQSKTKFLFKDLVQSKDDTVTEITVNVKKKTYSLSVQRKHLGESLLNS